MNTESRNIGYSYLMLRPPVEFFGQLFINHFDGGDLMYTLPIGDNILTFKAYAGKISDSFPVRGLGADYNVWEPDALFSGGLVEYLWDDWKVRATFDYAPISNNIPLHEDVLFPFLRNLPFPQSAALEDQLRFKDRSFKYYSLAFSWNPSPFSLDMAMSVTDTDIQLIPSSLNGYLTAGYRLGRVTPYLSLAWTLPLSGNRVARLPNLLPGITDAVNAQLSAAEQQVSFERTTVSTGLRWDLMTNVDAKFQIDFVQGDSNNTLWESVTNHNSPNGSTVVFGAALDFVF